MIKINLLAAEMIKKEERYELVIVAYALLAAAIVLAVFDYTLKVSSFKKLEDRVSQSQRELSKYESILKQVESLQATTKVLETKKNVIGTLMQGRLTYVYFMEDILETLPYNLWFKSVNTQLGTDGMMKVNLDASSSDNYAIADFVSSLSSNNSYADVDLGPITTSMSARSSVSSFRVSFNYKKHNL